MSKHIYENKNKYFELIREFLSKEIDGVSFRNAFSAQRNVDLDADIELMNKHNVFTPGFGASESKWKEWEKALVSIGYPKLDNLFTNTVSYIYSQLDNFWPRDDEIFDESTDIDEDELRKRVQAKMDMLEETKGQW